MNEYKNEYMQQPIIFLTDENLEKLEKHCEKSIPFERGIEHKVTLELLKEYKEQKQEIEKLKLTEFMIVRNSKVLPIGLDLLKSDAEITQKTKEVIKELEKMIDYEKAKKLYELEVKGNTSFLERNKN